MYITLINNDIKYSVVHKKNSSMCISDEIYPSECKLTLERNRALRKPNFYTISTPLFKRFKQQIYKILCTFRSLIKGVYNVNNTLTY